MSAMLVYLLNPNQDHGLDRKFIDAFLELANTNQIYDIFINDKTKRLSINKI
jgi:hypothetical protein